MTDRETFASAFIEAALFADLPEESPDAILSSETDLAMRNFARRFYDANADDCETYGQGLVQAGHDLWFSIAGHGCGYWEQSDQVSERLEAAAKLALPYNEGLYAGDDGLLYWMAGEAVA